MLELTTKQLKQVTGGSGTGYDLPPAPTLDTSPFNDDVAKSRIMRGIN